MKNSMMLAMALMISTMIFAQQKHRDPQQIAAWQTEKMKENLALNDTQYASVKKINESYADKFASVRKDDKKVTGEKREALKTIRREHVQAINSVLTPDQQQKWKTLREEKKAERKEHRHARHEHRKEKVKTALSLTDDQASRIESINKDFIEKRHAVKIDKSLSESEMETKLESLKTEHNTAMKSILTDEQFKKWQELKKDHKHKNHKRK
jgi:Spy/CpxP family protein refolding chaperone